MLYEQVAKPLLDQVLQGYNCTIFAYGQTGTGKTFTMEGDLSPQGATFHDDAGLIPRTLYYLFDHLSKSSSSSSEGTTEEYTVKCSYVELYNEELRDLNARQGEEGLPLKIYDESPASTTTMKSSSSSSSSSSTASTSSSSTTPTTTTGNPNPSSNGGGGGSVRIEGLEETFITDAEEGLEVLRRGSTRRISASTNMNERSSRSHSIFQIIVTLKDSSNSSLLRVGKLNLVDLAGSENVARSGAVQGRAREAGRINVSLLALGRVINLLSSKNNNNNNGNNNGNDQQHIPYRESKLTRLLQDSLGGNTKTTIIATISPTSYEETSSTLSYALQATSIQNKPEQNRKVGKDVILNQVLTELHRCRLDLKAARSQGQDADQGEGGGYYVSRETFQELELERLNFKLGQESHLKVLNDLEIQSIELQSSRDQLEQNVRALSKLKSSLKLNQQVLLERDYELQESRRDNEFLKVENEKLKCLNKAWELSRKGWKDDCQDALRDVENLYEKLQRKTLVEQSNVSVLNETCSLISSKTFEISRQTSQILTEQTNFSESVQTRLEKFKQRQSLTLKENDLKIDFFLKEMIEKSLNQVSNESLEMFKFGKVYRETIETTCLKLFTKFTEKERLRSIEQDELRNRLLNELKTHQLEVSVLIYPLD
jgi:kinesin family protein 11